MQVLGMQPNSMTLTWLSVCNSDALFIITTLLITFEKKDELLSSFINEY